MRAVIDKHKKWLFNLNRYHSPYLLNYLTTIPVIQLFHWTDGCIGLSDKDMDEVWAAVDPGTPIEIRP